MSALITICALAVLAIQVWLIVLFVRMSGNVKTMLSLMQEQKGMSALSTADAKLAVLLNKEDEMYEKLIKKLFRLYTSSIAQYGPQNAQLHVKDSIKAAISICNILGREFPAQLMTVEAFQSYIKQ